MDVQSAWMKQERVHGDQVVASTQAEAVEDDLVAAAGAEVS